MAKKLLDYNLDDLYEWIENGKSAVVDESFMKYVELLDKVRSMMLRKDIYGNKETIIRHLITFEPELQKNKHRAAQIYSESIEYFYTQDTISKKAWRNLYAEDLDKAYDLAIALAETSSDVDKATKIKERAAKIRALDQVDPPEIPKNIFSRPNKVYSMDMDLWEIGSEDRNDAVAWVEENGKKLSLKQIDRIKQEIGATKIKIFQDETEDPRKD
jgi:hypothetical protein